MHFAWRNNEYKVLLQYFTYIRNCCINARILINSVPFIARLSHDSAVLSIPSEKLSCTPHNFRALELPKWRSPPFHAAISSQRMAYVNRIQKWDSKNLASQTSCMSSRQVY